MCEGATTPKFDIESARQFLNEIEHKLKVGGDVRSFIDTSSSYHKQYPSLIEFGKRTLKERSPDDMIVLALAVYGWMPTIPKNELVQLNKETLDDLAVHEKELANGEARKNHAIKVIEKIGNKGPINDSWVGSSKFLHFLRPDLFPIFDSRVGRRFGLTYRAQWERQEVYCYYVKFMHSEIKNRDYLIERVSGTLTQTLSKKNIELRALELLLFGAT